MGGVPPLGYRVETTSFESAPPHQRECTCDDEGRVEAAGRGDDVAGYDRRQLLDDPRSAAEEPKVRRLAAGGEWIRTSSSAPDRVTVSTRICMISSALLCRGRRAAAYIIIQQRVVQRRLLPRPSRKLGETLSVLTGRSYQTLKLLRLSCGRSLILYLRGHGWEQN